MVNLADTFKLKLITTSTLRKYEATHTGCGAHTSLTPRSLITSPLQFHTKLVLAERRQIGHDSIFAKSSTTLQFTSQ